MKATIFLFCLTAFSTVLMAQKKKGFELLEQPAKKQVDVLFDNKLITAYCYYDSIRKPILFPINTIDGITVTRGYPIDPKPGERTDHPHHNGLWMNYESVNGLDFWNNSTAIAPAKRNGYGTIRHKAVTNKKTSAKEATLSTIAEWLHPDGHVLLNETTTYEFSVEDNLLFIDRTTTLTALDEEVVFKDVKDGFLAIRVARELELPSTEKGAFLDIHGNKTEVPQMDNKDVTGNYYSSEGKKGDSVWGTKGKWVMLKGKKEGREITIAIIDHPSNIGYPSYWHARGYGLFAINPLGKKVFSNGKEELNLVLKPHSSVSFRYRVLVSSSSISAKRMNELAEAFAKQKVKARKAES